MCAGQPTKPLPRPCTRFRRRSTPALPVDVPLLVFNPLAWQRSGVTTVDVEMPSASPNGVSVLDAQNHVLPSEVVSSNGKTNSYRLLVEAKDVPSLGYSLLHVVPGKRPFVSDLKVNGTTIENAALKVTVDPQTGCITSLYDKKANFETLAQGACGNELIAFKDTPKDYDAWNIDADFDKVFTKLDKADSVELVEKGPLKAVIRVTRTWQSSKFVQDITLYNGVDRVDVVNDIDWHETHILLKAAFPLAASSSKATYEIPYGSIERPTTRNNSWEDAKFEVPAMRWADLGDGQHGFSLINESKYGYDAKGNVLRLSLLRSPTWPDPDADRGHHHFTLRALSACRRLEAGSNGSAGLRFQLSAEGDAGGGAQRNAACGTLLRDGAAGDGSLDRDEEDRRRQRVDLAAV